MVKFDFGNNITKYFRIYEFVDQMIKDLGSSSAYYQNVKKYIDKNIHKFITPELENLIFEILRKKYFMIPR